MPYVQMIETTKASPDGIVVETFVEKEIYQVSDKLAEIFTEQMEVAIEVDNPNKKPVEEKDAGESPENKDAGKSTSTKDSKRVQSRKGKKK